MKGGWGEERPSGNTGLIHYPIESTARETLIDVGSWSQHHVIVDVTLLISFTPLISCRVLFVGEQDTQPTYYGTTTATTVFPSSICTIPALTGCDDGNAGLH